LDKEGGGMKNLIWALLLLAGISNAWGQLPTPTPKPILILKSINLNDPTLIPPLKLFILGTIGVGEYGGNFDLEILDDRSNAKTIYGASLIDRLWIGAFGSEQIPQNGYIFFEEFKVFKKIDSNSCLVKIPNPHFTTTGIGENNNAFMNIYGHNSKIYYLTSSDGSIRFDDLKEGESVNAVVKVDGYFTREENGGSENFIKLNVVSSQEPNVWALMPTPNADGQNSVALLSASTPKVVTSSQNGNGYHFTDSSGNDFDYYPDLSLFLEANGMVGKFCGGSFTIIKKVNKNGWLVEATADDGVGSASKTFYLKIPKSWDVQTITHDPGAFGVGSKMVNKTSAPHFRALTCLNLIVLVTDKFMKFTNSLDDSEDSIRVLELKAIAAQPCM
jgi:hypothetical protein